VIFKEQALSNQPFIVRLHEDYARYCEWLRSQPAAVHLKRAQRYRLTQFINFAERSFRNYKDVVATETLKDRIAGDYLDYLQYFLKARPSTVNKAFNTINQFYEFVGLEPLRLDREDLPSLQPQALTLSQLDAFLSGAKGCDSIKHKAVALAVATTGIRASECIALNVDDYNADAGLLTIKPSEFEGSRAVAVDEKTRGALIEWLELRKQKFNRLNESALFLNPQRRRMSQAGVNLVIRKIAQEVGLTITAQQLRDTFLLNAMQEHGGKPDAKIRYESVRVRAALTNSG
jgi:integrase